MNSPPKLSASEAVALGKNLILAHQAIELSEREAVETRSKARFGHWRKLYQIVAPFSSRTWIDQALATALKCYWIDPRPEKWIGYAFRSIPKGDSERILGRVVTVRYQPESCAVMVEVAQRIYDTHGDADRIPISELIFNGARELQFVPRFVIQHTITNDETNKFIEKALDSLGVWFPIEGGTVQILPDTEWFPLLLGSDSGRAAQQMVNSHPATFNGDSVKEIEIVQNDRGTSHLILFIGESA